MSARPRFVFDTNVLIDTALFRQSFGRRAFVLARTIGTVIASRSTMIEMESVLRRPKFNRFLPLADRQTAVAAIGQMIEQIEPWFHCRVCRDPTDDKLIHLAICAEATALVTRDADLLTLHPINGITVQDAQAFVLANSLSP